MQTFMHLRFEQIEKRFFEIDILIELAVANQNSIHKYHSLCRSAHVLLVSHFEGLYREICKDVIDDINQSTKFIEVKRVIFNTFCEYFVKSDENKFDTNKVKDRLWDAFRDYQSNIKIAPFLKVENKNPTPNILESILKKFGKRNFFNELQGSDLDIVFEDRKKQTVVLRNRGGGGGGGGTKQFPYTLDPSFYSPKITDQASKKDSLWVEFINSFLVDRHNIVHGHAIEYQHGHESLIDAKIKLEILIYAFMINICSMANPIFLLSEDKL